MKVETCKLNGVLPMDYFIKVLEALTDAKRTHLWCCLNLGEYYSYSQTARLQQTDEVARTSIRFLESDHCKKMTRTLEHRGEAWRVLVEQR